MAETENKSVLYEKTEHIGIITINKPKSRNSWGDDVSELMFQYFNEMEQDKDVLVTILTGNQEAGAFSAGAEVTKKETHMTDADHIPEALRFGGGTWFERLSKFPKPVICAINGFAMGIGALSTLRCDIILMSDNAEYGLPQVSLGLIPGFGGALALARFVGKGNAMKMILLSERIKADEAFRIGLAQKVVPLPELMPEAMKMARRIASLPPLGVKLAKEAMNAGLDIGNLALAQLGDAYRFILLGMTEDAREAPAAWREKRQGDFKGR